MRLVHLSILPLSILDETSNTAEVSHQSPLVSNLDPKS